MRADVVGVATGAGAALLMGTGDGAVATPLVVLAASVAAVAVVAAHALKARGRLRKLERALADERARALEALAARERRSGEAERLAAAAARVAALAHDMAGPVAAIRANLDWLEGALHDGRLADRDGETRSVLQDGRAAVEALVRALSELRRAYDTARRGPAPGSRPDEHPPARSISGE